jgi:TRAP-type mannitol/chloroaromatic compound transport system substrate-binding protein
MGMVVRQLPGGEIQPAMKTGLIDAAEFNNPYIRLAVWNARCI